MLNDKKNSIQYVEVFFVGIGTMSKCDNFSFQILAIPHFLRGSNTMIAAETGNGKTLAFLAPLVHQLMKSKSIDEHALNSPRALIIVPGRELAIQIRVRHLYI